VITEPGVYSLPVEDYHRDPVQGGSLSSTGARKLLPPSCPAKFREWVDSGEDPTPAFDLGHAAHAQVLGAGPEIVVVRAPNWRTKEAKEQAAEARERGAVPILWHQYEQVQAMAAKLRAHPLASRLLDPAHGWAEQTIVWRDRDFGVMRRAMVDYLPHTSTKHRMIIPDYKTCQAADPDGISRAFASYQYPQQAAWYEDGAAALGLDSDGPPVVVFIFQETEPPYVVTVVTPEPSAMAMARVRNRKAVAVYRDCVTANEWPDYHAAEYRGEVIPVGMPRWAEYQHADLMTAGAFDI
jgi:hypothetical protein